MSELVPQQAGELAHLDGDPFRVALAVWLQGKRTNTQRAYARAVADFFEFAGKRPADVLPLDVAAWKEDLKARGLVDATIAARLSALSSYYAKLQEPGPNGKPLHEFNPVAGVDRDDLETSPYEKARALTAEEFNAILAEIDAQTPSGAMYRAVFLFYVLCARRRAEVVKLCGRDLKWSGDRMTYRVRLKRGKVKWKELPPPVWAAIRHYLEQAGRQLVDESPVFVATVDAGQHLRHYHGAGDPDGEQPISGEALQQALKRYAGHAGLDPDKVTLHGLRHLGAKLYQRASGDVRQTQLFLDHAHLNTTQVYLDQLEGEEHKHWQAMANRLGVE